MKLTSHEKKFLKKIIFNTIAEQLNTNYIYMLDYSISDKNYKILDNRRLNKDYLVSSKERLEEFDFMLNSLFVNHIEFVNLRFLIKLDKRAIIIFGFNSLSGINVDFENKLKSLIDQYLTISEIYEKYKLKEIKTSEQLASFWNMLPNCDENNISYTKHINAKYYNYGDNEQYLFSYCESRFYLAKNITFTLDNDKADRLACRTKVNCINDYCLFLIIKQYCKINNIYFEDNKLKMLDKDFADVYYFRENLNMICSYINERYPFQMNNIDLNYLIINFGDIVLNKIEKNPGLYLKKE